jgi:hypothetical protein
VSYTQTFSKQGLGFESIVRVAVDHGCTLRIEGAPDGGDGLEVEMLELGVTPERRYYTKRTYDLAFTAERAREFFESR